MAFRLIAAAAVLATLIGAPATALTTQPWPETQPTCSALPSALRSGATLVCTDPVTAERRFELEHRLRCDEAELCLYTQTLPDNMTLWCRFSPQGREAYATIIETRADGPIWGIMARECELRDSAGAIIPFESARSGDEAH